MDEWKIGYEAGWGAAEAKHAASRNLETTARVPDPVTPPTSPPPKPDDARRSVLPATIREVAYADAEYVLEWLRQSEAPANIVQLQERATAYLGVASGR